MSADLSETALCNAIGAALKTAHKSESLSEPVSMNSRMGSPKEWDSLSFVAVFTAISESFDIELEDDDAIHFQAAQSIFDFLTEIMDE